MKLTLIGINFNYANGLNADYSSVKLNFTSSGTTFNLSGFVQATSDEYAAAAGDMTSLTNLVIQKVNENLNAQ